METSPSRDSEINETPSRSRDEMVDLLLNDPQEYIRLREQHLAEIGYIRPAERGPVVRENERQITAVDTANRQEINPKASETNKQMSRDDEVDLLLSDPEEYIRLREQELHDIGYIRGERDETDRRPTALETASREEINGRTIFSVPAIIRGFKARRQR